MLEYERDVNSARQTKETMVIFFEHHLMSPCPLVVTNCHCREFAVCRACNVFVFVDQRTVRRIVVTQFDMDGRARLTRQLHPM